MIRGEEERRSKRELRGVLRIQRTIVCLQSLARASVACKQPELNEEILRGIEPCICIWDLCISWMRSRDTRMTSVSKRTRTSEYALFHVSPAPFFLPFRPDR